MSNLAFAPRHDEGFSLWQGRLQQILKRDRLTLALKSSLLWHNTGYADCEFMGRKVFALEAYMSSEGLALYESPREREL